MNKPLVLAVLLFAATTSLTAAQWMATTESFLCNNCEAPIDAYQQLRAANVRYIRYFAPWPLIYYGPEKAQLYSGLLMTLVGFLSVMMVSTWRFSSFKTVGMRVRSMRIIILVLSVGMLIFLFSQYVLLAIVVGYILHGLLSRIFWRRGEAKAEAKLEAKPVGRS